MPSIPATLRGGDDRYRASHSAQCAGLKQNSLKLDGADQCAKTALGFAKSCLQA